MRSPPGRWPSTLPGQGTGIQATERLDTIQRAEPLAPRESALTNKHTPCVYVSAPSIKLRDSAPAIPRLSQVSKPYLQKLPYALSQHARGPTGFAVAWLRTIQQGGRDGQERRGADRRHRTADGITQGTQAAHQGKGERQGPQTPHPPDHPTGRHPRQRRGARLQRGRMGRRGQPSEAPRHAQGPRRRTTRRPRRARPGRRPR